MIAVIGAIPVIRTWGKEGAPDVLKGFIELDATDGISMINEFQKFCDAIPELADNEQIQEQLGQELTMRLLGVGFAIENSDDLNPQNEVAEDKVGVGNLIP